MCANVSVRLPHARLRITAEPLHNLSSRNHHIPTTISCSFILLANANESAFVWSMSIILTAH